MGFGDQKEEVSYAVPLDLEVLRTPEIFAASRVARHLGLSGSSMTADKAHGYARDAQVCITRTWHVLKPKGFDHRARDTKRQAAMPLILSQRPRQDTQKQSERRTELQIRCRTSKS